MTDDTIWSGDVVDKDTTTDLATEISTFVETLIPEALVINEPADGYPVVSFKVPGTPAPQGSKVAFNRRNKAGQVVSAQPIMKETGKRIAQFRTDVKIAADHAMGRDEQGQGGHPPLEGPVLLDVVFVFVRPKAHYNTKGQLNKQGLATPGPIGHNLGDLSKLCRAIEDSMTKIVYGDDSQITTFGRPRKRWGISAATYITVRPDPLDP